jgi:hypothetical protein
MLGVIVAFVITLLIVAISSIEGKEIRLVIAIKALADGLAAFERLGHACAIVL